MGIPLDRYESCGTNSADDVVHGDRIAHTGSSDHILLDHGGPEVICAEAQGDLSHLQTLRYPGSLDVVNVVEIYP